MIFEVPPRMDEWTEEHVKAGCKSYATAGEQFMYIFLPTTIVDISTVKCLCCGKELTLYDGLPLRKQK